MGAPNHLKTLSPHSLLHPSIQYPVFQLPFSTRSYSWTLLILPPNQWNTSHTALHISLTSPHTDTIPPSVPSHLSSPSLSNTSNPHPPTILKEHPNSLTLRRRRFPPNNLFSFLLRLSLYSTLWWISSNPGIWLLIFRPKSPPSHATPPQFSPFCLCDL